MSSTETQQVVCEDTEIIQKTNNDLNRQRSQIPIDQIRKELFIYINNANIIHQEIESIKKHIQIIDLHQLINEGFIIQQQDKKIIKIDVSKAFNNNKFNISLDTNVDILKINSENKLQEDIAGLKKSYQKMIQNYEKVLKIIKQKNINDGRIAKQNIHKSNKSHQENQSPILKQRELILQLKQANKILKNEIEQVRIQRDYQKANLVKVIQNLKQQNQLLRRVKQSNKQWYVEDIQSSGFTFRKRTSVRQTRTKKKDNVQKHFQLPPTQILSSQYLKLDTKLQKKQEQQFCLKMNIKQTRQQSQRIKSPRQDDKQISSIGLFPKRYGRQNYSRSSSHSKNEFKQLLMEMEKLNSLERKEKKKQEKKVYQNWILIDIIIFEKQTLNYQKLTFNIITNLQ